MLLLASRLLLLLMVNYLIHMNTLRGADAVVMNFMMFEKFGTNNTASSNFD